jgi:hypothetical protein
MVPEQGGHVDAGVSATGTVQLEGDVGTTAHRLGQAATDADIVIDYLGTSPPPP